MIIRALVKAATWLAFTPIPEYVHVIGRLASLGALVGACNTNVSEEEIEKPNPFYSPGSDAPETITFVKKDYTAADVWLKLYPSEDFSIREAVKTYKGLDQDQKEIFVLSALGAACEAFYVFHSLWRFGITIGERDNFKQRAEEAERKNLYAILCLRKKKKRK